MKTLVQANRSSRKNNRLSTAKKLTMGLAVAVAVLFAAEGMARLLLPESGSTRFRQINELVVFLGTHESDLMLDFDAERFWKLKPNIHIDDPNNTFWQGQVSNSLGYRCPEFSLQKTPDTFRVVCFGDSSTFGIGAKMEDTWPSQLQVLLNQQQAGGEARRIEVVNAGVPGYTSYQGLQFMRQEIDRLQPDLVMASYANNDFWHWDQQTDEQHALRLASSHGIREIVMQSRLAQVLDDTIRAMRDSDVQQASSSQGSPNQDWAAEATASYFEPESAWTQRVPLEAFRKNINTMADLCEQRRLPLILVKWPDQPQAGGHWSPRIAYQDVLEEIAAERRLQVADIVRHFQDNRGWSVQTYVPNDIVHVNRNGNTLAAIAAIEAINRIRNRRDTLTN